MKLTDLLEGAYPITVVALRAFPSGKGRAHSAVSQTDALKVRPPAARKRKPFLKTAGAARGAG